MPIISLFVRLWQADIEHQANAIPNLASHELQRTPKRIVQDQTHKVKNFAYLAGW